MTVHRAVIEAGPGAIRRLCCGANAVADDERSAAALGAIDDPVALVDGRPVAVASLWCAALRSLDCGGTDGMTVVHPSWWSAVRVDLVLAAARTLTEDVVAQPRSWLLTRASPQASAVVEIADRIVAIAADGVAAVPRRREAHPVAEEVAAVIARSTRKAVLIDAPSTVAGAAALAKLIAGALRGSDRTVVVIDDARLTRLARAAHSGEDEPVAPASAARFRARSMAWLAATGVVLAAATPAVLGGSPHRVPAAAPARRMPATFLVEGRVALTVPADWPTQRVVAGPGSARVQVTSPSDPELALHVTQSAVAGETLSGTAERLKRAIDAEPAGVFVDFNPAGISAGRTAVTYREIRAGHQVSWAVLLDGAVRISIGCQSRPGREDAVREVCEQAVRSARAIE